MPAGVCVGCLGSGRCWVCLGSGFLDPQSRRGVCGRCRGTRRCHLCSADGTAVVLERPSRRSVLVIDDEQHILDLVTIWLEDDDRCETVEAVSTGDAALLALAESCPDTILCDFRLEGTTTAGYLQGFRSACPQARIVVHTASPELAYAAKIVELGADLVLVKGSIDLPQLIDTILTD